MNPTCSGPRAFVTLTSSKTKKLGPKFLFDTGASVSLISPADFQVFRRHGLVRQKLHCSPQIFNASGSPMANDGVYDIKFFLNQRLCHGAFIVSPSLAGHSILGMNIIKAYGLILDPITSSVTASATPDLEVASLHTPDETTANQPWLVQVSEASVLEPFTSKRVRCRLVHPVTKLPLLKSTQFIADIDSLSVAMVSSEQGAFSPHLPNASHTAIELARGTILGTASPMGDHIFLTNRETVESIQAHTPLPRKHTPAEQRQIRLLIQERLAFSEIPYSVRPDYAEMLASYDDVFSADSNDLGLTDIIKHAIDVPNTDDPIYKGQFRLAADQLQLIKDNVAGWLRAGLVERSNSRFNSPVFCVPKKEGQGLRVVLDYRLLNHRSIPDKYSIRTIDQCLEEIGRSGSKLFSCLDLTNGFWQLKLSDASRPFTAFTIPGKGQFQWKVTPQGLMGAPASFSRLMDLIMSDAENIITYIDDVLVHSRDHASHIRHLAVALNRIRLAHLRLNPKKCIFAATSVQYLGHTITANGVMPGKDKTAAIRDIMPPATPKQLKSFLGLANYFRGFIRNFARAAAPLFHLTRKDIDWKGGPLPPVALAAFNTIREAICSKPVMAYPAREGKFTLTVDAAVGDASHAGGLGACLFQQQPDGTKRPVGFASRQLLKYEANYPPFLLELAGAVFGMDYFHHYLVGRRFELLTDHKPLVPLSTTHTKTLNRLQLKMQEMHPDVGYIPGPDNVVSDFLSRYQGVGVNSIDISSHTFLPAQREDALCKDLFERLRGKPVRPEGYKIPGLRHPVTILPKGCLAVILPPRKGYVNDHAPRAIVPAALTAAIIQEAHNSTIGGHGGAFRTMERIRELCWWPNMESHVQRHIQQCEVCGAAPHSQVGTRTPAQSLPLPSRPNQRVHIDLFGPLKTSDAGNKFVLVYTDAFTRMTRLVAIKDKSALSVARAVLDLIYTNGVPDQIHSDQGREFCNEMMSAIYDSLQINHTTTTPYHPQCNAAAERFNRTMASFLTKALADSDRSSLDWELYLGPLMLSYNSGVNKSTRMSPFYATFGFSPRLPLWGTEDEAEPLQNDDYASQMAKIRRAQCTARGILTTNSQDSQARAASKNGSTTFPSFARGDHVWVKINQKMLPNPKLCTSGEPGIILQRVTETTYKVLRYERRRRRAITLNITHLRRRTSHHLDDDRHTGLGQDQQTTQTAVPARGSDSHHPLEDGQEDIDNKPRRSTRIIRKPSRYSDSLDEQEMDHFIMAIQTTKSIAHLLPEFAQGLPFYEAIEFLDLSSLTFDGLMELLESGWSLASSSNNADPRQPNNAGPPSQPRRTSQGTRQPRILRRLMDHLQPGPSDRTSHAEVTKTATHDSSEEEDFTTPTTSPSMSPKIDAAKSKASRLSSKLNALGAGASSLARTAAKTAARLTTTPESSPSAPTRPPAQTRPPKPSTSAAKQLPTTQATAATKTANPTATKTTATKTAKPTTTATRSTGARKPSTQKTPALFKSKTTRPKK